MFFYQSFLYKVCNIYMQIYRLDLKVFKLQQKNKVILSLFITMEVSISCPMDLWSLLQLSVVPIIAIHLSCLLQVGWYL